MTAVEYKQYDLVCNRPSAGGPCRVRFRGREGEARARVRARARRDGWTQVRSDSGRYFDEDFCPAHPPEGS